MGRIDTTLARILRGDADASIRFTDLRSLLRHLRFAERIRGGHHIFTREGVAEILNLQPRGGRAKAYQVRQVRAVVVRYGLASELRQPPSAEDSTPGHEPDRDQETGNE
jgi:hypothetical protein